MTIHPWPYRLPVGLALGVVLARGAAGDGNPTVGAGDPRLGTTDLDGRRRIRGVYNGLLPLDMDRLIEDIATLAAAASRSAS